MEARYIPASKIQRYLLNVDHPDGGPKAVFYGRFGFSPDRPEQLAAALMMHALVNEVVEDTTSVHGLHHAVEGPLECPDGRAPRARSVWLINEEHKPKLVTAFPA